MTNWAVDPEYRRAVVEQWDVFEAIVRVLDKFPDAREAVAAALGDRAG